MFPDEIILHVCGYLRGIDVLRSFYDLNARLNITIAGYCRYVNLLAPAYKPFHHVVSYVLPRIGTSVRSFVLNGNWKPVMSANLLAILFGSQLPLMLPQLQTLTLKWFTVENMLLFLPGLENFSQLVALDIRMLNGRIEDTLMNKILSANNGRLQYVTCDEDCISLNIPEGDEIISYPNIEELTISVNVNRLFPRLFTFLPNVKRLHVALNEETDHPKFSTALANLPPLIHLIDFQLRSSYIFWTFDEILDLLRLMPSLQKLILTLFTNDERFVKGENLMTILPLSVTEIHVNMRYYFSQPDFNMDELYASWPHHLPITCLLDEARERLLLHTIPFSLRSMTLSAELSKQMSSGWNWKHLQQVEDLCVYNATSLAQILLVVQHFHHLRRLTINISNTIELCTETQPTPTTVIKLPRLKQLTVLKIFPLLSFVKAAPNLDFLVISLDCLTNLLKDEQICQLLQQRITRLDICNWLNAELNILQRVSQVFSNLHQLIIQPNDYNAIMDSIILEALANWYDKRLHWIFIGGSLSDDAKENLRQWLLDHNTLLANDSFAVDYSNQFFTLWK